MRKFWFYIKKILGDDKLYSLIKRNRDAITTENRHILIMLSVLGSVLIGVIFTLSLILPYLECMQPLYIPYFVAFLVALLMSLTVSKKSAIWLKVAAYFLVFVTAAFGIELGVFYNPTANANLCMVFLIVLPLMFIERPLYILPIALICCVVFCMATYYIKPTKYYQTDITNCCVCYIISMVAMRMIMSARIENIDARRRLYSESQTDELTHLPNRRAFSRCMKSLRRQILDRYGRIAVYMIDIDGFKSYNDTYGHVAGDECLSELGELFSEFAAKYDLTFCRYGGKEFAAISKDEELDLDAVGRELVETVYRIGIEHDKSAYKRVTISVGCADSILAGVASDIDIVNCADAALYEAKETGKNKYVRLH